MKVSLVNNSQKSVLYKNLRNNLNFYTKSYANDTVSFSSNVRYNYINCNKKAAQDAIDSLSTSTAGHRAKYGTKFFNEDIIELMTAGVGEYVKEQAEINGKEPRILIGGDTRKASRELLPLMRNILQNQGINVIYLEEPVPSPVLALNAVDYNVDTSILMTASHNPWSDGGFNLVTKNGAIAPVTVTKAAGKKMSEILDRGSYTTNLDKKGRVLNIDPYESYIEYLDERELIDWDRIRKSKIAVYYDGLEGTGSYVFPRILVDKDIPFYIGNSKGKSGPNPVKENLEELTNAVLAEDRCMKVGFSNDGDADRIGIIDETGRMLNPHEVVLLMVHHLKDNKNLDGKVLRSQSTSSQIDEYAHNKNLDVIQTPVGFKYIGADILKLRENNDDILVAGEESGGLTINGHIPEKDGILANLLMLDLIAADDKPLSWILCEQKSTLSSVYKTLTISKDFDCDMQKTLIMKKIYQIYNDAANGYLDFGNFTIDFKKTKEVMEDMKTYKEGGDGIKLYFTDGSSCLVRTSGTEPKIRIYIEAKAYSRGHCKQKMEDIRKTIEGICKNTF